MTSYHSFSALQKDKRTILVRKMACLINNIVSKAMTDYVKSRKRKATMIGFVGQNDEVKATVST